MAKSFGRSLLEESALISGLVTREQLDEALSAVVKAGVVGSRPVASVVEDAIAEQLVSMRLITPYQAEQLKAGRTKLTLGPYLVTDWIAQGGMGQVFKAVHQMMGREVAIKVLPYGRSTPEAVATFTREIRAQAQLDHQNLVRAYDAGHDGNVYFLVTEFVPGADLRRLVRSQGPLTMQQAASVIRDAALGLAHAHRRGLVHRDVKPGNILVTPDGRAKVSDLGLAGWLRAEEQDANHAKIVGTADYLSPEHIKTPGELTAAADIYSLGCTLYYAITAKVPYPGGSTQDKARRHCEATPWHPRKFSPEVAEEFVDIIADMMDKDPTRRIQTALEVAGRLEPWGSDVEPIPADKLAKSPWMAPSLPSGSDDSGWELSDTDDGSSQNVEGDAQASRESSQESQGSDTLTSRAQQTLPIFEWERVPVPPPLPGQYSSSSLKSVLIALAVAVPISMLVGSLLTLVAILLR